MTTEGQHQLPIRAGIDRISIVIEKHNDFLLVFSLFSSFSSFSSLIISLSFSSFSKSIDIIFSLSFSERRGIDLDGICQEPSAQLFILSILKFKIYNL
jgi:hypothetical protein|tara:strand:- start:13138 stop:13431 length:294 start_codon:yes stop_codon:yes gene_type:complete